MRTRTLWPLIALELTLTGCAHDSYTVIPGGSGSADRMHSDVMECKNEAIDAYYKGRSESGALTGAILGGAIGGAIGGAVDASANTNTMKLSDMKPMIEACMLKKGYAANQDNEP